MKKKFFGLLSVLLILMFTTTNVYAKSLTKAGDTVIQEGEYDSIRLVAGNKVTNKAKVDGISLIAGNDLTLEGSTPYGFYAGNNITISENISKDMFVAGNKIVVTKDAVVGRDAFIFGSNVTIETNIPGDLRTGGDIVDIRGIKIDGNAYIEASDIILDENTVITGKLTYPEESNIKGIDKATIGKIKTTKYEKVVIERTITDIITDFIFSACAAFVVMFVLLYLKPSIKDKLDKVELKADSILKNIGIGLAVLIVVPFVTLFALFTRVLLPLALITGVIYVISIYVAYLLAYYIVGNILTEKLLNQKNNYLALGIGIVVVKLITLIPVIGPLVATACLFYGMGLIYK